MQRVEPGDGIAALHDLDGQCQNGFAQMTGRPV
jgi:hypothetical protein